MKIKDKKKILLLIRFLRINLLALPLIKTYFKTQKQYFFLDP